MIDYRKPLPAPDAISAPYWEACLRHELVLQRCAECGAFRFPPASICARCRSPLSEWVRASGRGKVYSWIVVVHPVPKDVYAADVPYVVALVEMEEGVRMPTNIVGCDPGEIRADMPVEVVFEDVSDEISLAKFRPA
ncbi:MAG: OB-fold domain-containing protein [Chloroflexi bacterium]|nr:OB-fold domain-containing protein [Chloroflexota bacterium]